MLKCRIRPEGMLSTNRIAEEFGVDSDGKFRLIHAILGVRKRSGKSFETLYILTCKNTYADIQYTEPDEVQIWNIIGHTYSEVWERAEEIPDEGELRSWIRSIITLVYSEVTGNAIEGFPDESETYEGNLEPFMSEMLFRLDDVLGIYNDSDEADTLEKGKHETIETEEKRSRLNKKFRTRAIIGTIMAVLITAIAVAVVLGTLSSLKKRDNLIERKVNTVIVNTEEETLEAPHGGN